LFGGIQCEGDKGFFINQKGAVKMHINWKIVLIALAAVVGYALVKKYAPASVTSFLP
jgi:hypothetical protein